MTRYEYGFLTKCADCGIPASVSSRLLEKSASWRHLWSREKSIDDARRLLVRLAGRQRKAMAPILEKERTLAERFPMAYFKEVASPEYRRISGDVTNASDVHLRKAMDALGVEAAKVDDSFKKSRAYKALMRIIEKNQLEINPEAEMELSSLGKINPLSIPENTKTESILNTIGRTRIGRRLFGL